MLLSVIVPAYNVQDYIGRCLKSICRQNLSPDLFEVIIVNDGSIDDTLLIINSVVDSYPNISFTIINKDNGGLSSARNAGFNIAKGDYVWFIDSDDYIESNTFLEINEVIRNNPEVDMFVFNTDYIYDDIPSKENKRRLPQSRIISGEELYLMDFRYPYSGVQFSIYKSSSLKNMNLTFKEGILFEDILFNTIWLASNVKCYFIDKVYYHYYIRQGSITNSVVSVKKCFDMILIADILDSLVCEKYYNQRVLRDQISKLLGVLFRYNLRFLKHSDRIIVKREINKRDYWFKSIIASRQYKYLLYLFLK